MKAMCGVDNLEPSTISVVLMLDNVFGVCKLKFEGFRLVKWGQLDVLFKQLSLKQWTLITDVQLGDSFEDLSDFVASNAWQWKILPNLVTKCLVVLVGFNTNHD